MRCCLDRPAVPEVIGPPGPDGTWPVDLDLDLDDRQADGLTGIRCGARAGRMVPVGWADRPPEILARLGVSPDSARCQVFAHDECQLTRQPPAPGGTGR